MTDHTEPNDAPMTDRINAEPAILRGLSSTEAQLAIGVSLAAWTVFSVPFSFLIGYPQVSIIFIAAGTIGTVWMLSGWFQRVKRDRPDFYYQHMYKKWMTRAGLMRARFVTQSGIWELGRSVPPQVRSSRLFRRKSGEQ
jgi:conjugative transfer region protein (TIGR03750 family)